MRACQECIDLWAVRLITSDSWRKPISAMKLRTTREK